LYSALSPLIAEARDSDGAQSIEGGDQS